MAPIPRAPPRDGHANARHRRRRRRRSRRGVARRPAQLARSDLLALWPALGGHWLELFFLNWLRPRLPAARAAQVVARLALWLAGGTAFAAAMHATAVAMHRHPRRPAWWVGGLAFIGIELVAHLALQLRGRDSFYNGRG